jgi:hypothetical protein
MPERRELYRSPNGDCWFLGREPKDGRAFVIHQANGPSGAHLSHIDPGGVSQCRDGGAGTPSPLATDWNTSGGSPVCRPDLGREASR